MNFAISHNGNEVTIDVTWWESAMDNRIEFYVVFAGQQETFINFVKRKNHTDLIEESSSADLPSDIKAAIKNRLMYFTEHPNK